MQFAQCMKRARERRRSDSGPIIRSAPPAAGRRSTAARAYGAVPAIRARDDVAPGADGRPRLLGPGWGHFMPSLDDDLDDPMQARDPASDEERPGDADPLQDAEETEAPDGEQEAEGKELGAENEKDEEEEDEEDGAALESPQGAVDAAVSETGDAQAGRDLAPAGDEDREKGEEDEDRDDSLDDRSAGRTATAARLGPIDPPIPRPPRRKRKPSFDRILRGKGWKKIGMEGVRMKRSGSTVILAIDRSNRRVKLDTTSARGRFDMSKQAKKQGAAIAINGDLFGFASGKTSGLHRRNGRNLNGSKRQPGSAMFAFERPHGGRVGILSGNNRLPRWANNVVSGRPIIVNNGRVVQRYAPADQARLNSRTGRSAVGLSRDGRVMFLATAGRATTKEMANLLKRSGADDALALDGSGSAQMYLRGSGKNRGLVRRGDRRPIANALLVKTRG